MNFTFQNIFPILMFTVGQGEILGGKQTTLPPFAVLLCGRKERTGGSPASSR